MWGRSSAPSKAAEFPGDAQKVSGNEFKDDLPLVRKDLEGNAHPLEEMDSDDDDEAVLATMNASALASEFEKSLEPTFWQSITSFDFWYVKQGTEDFP